MRNFLFVLLALLYGCENKNNLTHSIKIKYINKEDVINELKDNRQVLQLNYYESKNKENSNNQINYILDIDYQSKIKGNLDTSSYIELISMSKNLAIYSKGKNTFLLSVSTGDSILYDVYQCSKIKKYVDTYHEKKDTVDKILLFQRKEFF